MSIIVNIVKIESGSNADWEEFVDSHKYSANVISFDASNLISEEEDLIVRHSIEYTSALELDEGSSDFEFIYTSGLWNYLQDVEYYSNKYNSYGLIITVDGETVIWSAIDKDTITWDKIQNRIRLSTRGWFKEMMDVLGHKQIGYVSSYSEGDTVDVDNYLENYFSGTAVVSSMEFKLAGASKELDANFLRVGLSIYGFTLNQLMTEIFKHYGAYAYIDPLKVMHIECRGKTPEGIASADDPVISPPAIDSIIVEETYEIRTKLDYNAVFCNGFYNPDYWQVEGTEDDGWLLLTSAYECLSIGYEHQISDAYKYIDIRQKLSPSFGVATEWYLFDTEARPSYIGKKNNYWDLYSNLLGVQEIINTDILSISYNLFDSVKVGSYNYVIFEIEKNITKKRSRVELRRNLPLYESTS